MNLAIFFDPLREELISSAYSTSTLATCVTPFLGVFPDWRTADIALIGLNEWRGSAAGQPATHGADEVRRRFYQLQRGSGNIRLADLGNLRPGITLDHTYQRLREIIGALLEHGTVPILLGGSHDLDYGQFLAYETLDRTVNFATIDSHVDMAEQAGSRAEDSHLRRMLMHEPNFLFSFAQLAHQQYLVAPDVLVALEKMHFERLRLGQIRDDIRQAEPLLRHADFVSFDVAALRWNDAPGYYPANPFGLTNEEAAKLAEYAGRNDKLTSFGLYGYRPDHDIHGMAAATLATMLWYFVEGYYHRCPEPNFHSQRFVRYAVGLADKPDRPGKLVFYKSRQTEKWWLEVEGFANSEVKRIIPCSYEDYIHAAQGDIPNRFFMTQALLG